MDVESTLISVSYRYTLLAMFKVVMSKLWQQHVFVPQQNPKNITEALTPTPKKLLRFIE